MCLLYLQFLHSLVPRSSIWRSTPPWPYSYRGEHQYHITRLTLRGAPSLRCYFGTGNTSYYVWTALLANATGRERMDRKTL